MVIAGVRIDDYADRVERDLRLKREHQVLADDAYRDVGLPGAPGPMAGEDLSAYRRRLLAPLARHAGQWKDALPGCPADALHIAEADIYAAARKAAANPTLGKDFKPGGPLRERKVKDESGREWTEYYGSPASWMDVFKRPLQFAVGGIRLPNGKTYGQR